MSKQFLIAAGFALATATLAGQAPAQAANEPWCAESSFRSGGTLQCNFVSFEQCRAYTSGIGGTCTPNYAAAYDAQARYMGPAYLAPQPRPRMRTYYYD